MSIRITLVLILCLQSFRLSSQPGIHTTWLMGYACCDTNFATMNLEFGSGNLAISTVPRDMNLNCTNGVISDEAGNVLFYSNGIYIANRQGDTMINGSGLNPAYWTDTRIPYGLTIPQGNLIIPVPSDSSKYYLFHQTCDDYGVTFGAFFLYYSIIDMSLDNGLGAVTLKNEVLLDDLLVLGRLTAVKHANGRDWWLICHQLYTGMVFKYLITSQGIVGPYMQDLITSRDIHYGQCVFSPQGDKFAYYEPSSDLDIWDFDRCSGNFSNLIHVNINDSAPGGGAAFSPSGRYFMLLVLIIYINLICGLPTFH